jgi:hypothetical protein
VSKNFAFTLPLSFGADGGLPFPGPSIRCNPIASASIAMRKRWRIEADFRPSTNPLRESARRRSSATSYRADDFVRTVGSIRCRVGEQRGRLPVDRASAFVRAIADEQP